MNHSTVRFAVVGCGVISKVHLDAIAKRSGINRRV
jgi:hypothetical protein